MTTRSVRCPGDQVETATWQLRHPGTGRVVTLVGMMHIGDSTYYRSVNDLVDELAAGGAEIQYEQIRKLSDTELAELHPDERTKVEELRTLLKEAGAPIMADALGLSLQLKEIDYPEGSKNIDHSEVELFRALGYERAKQLFDRRSLKDLDPETFRKVLRFVLKHYSILSLFALLFPRGRAMRKVILEERNDVALAGARTRLADGDVALVWGAAHLPGMRKALEEDGYRMVSETWRTVCTL